MRNGGGGGGGGRGEGRGCGAVKCDERCIKFCMRKRVLNYSRGKQGNGLTTVEALNNRSSRKSRQDGLQFF